MSIDKAMNKRIIEKKYKKKFQNVFAKTLTCALGQKVPPSRIKFTYQDEEGHHVLIGHYQNYTMTVNLTNKVVNEDDHS